MNSLSIDIKVYIDSSFDKSLKALGRAHSSVGWIEDLRTGGRWFDPRLGRYSFRAQMIVIASLFLSLEPLSVLSTMFMWESLERIMCGVLVKRIPGKHGWMH